MTAATPHETEPSVRDATDVSSASAATTIPASTGWYDPDGVAWEPERTDAVDLLRTSQRPPMEVADDREH